MVCSLLDSRSSCIIHERLWRVSNAAKNIYVYAHMFGVGGSCPSKGSAEGVVRRGVGRSLV